jgi:hypothetical protein
VADLDCHLGCPWANNSNGPFFAPSVSGSGGELWNLLERCRKGHVERAGSPAVIPAGLSPRSVDSP